MIKEYFKKVKQSTFKSCWELIDREYPEVKDKYTLMYDLVNKSIESLENRLDKITILDAGCGHSTMTDYKSTAKLTFIGADLSQDNVKNNEDIDFGFVSDLNQIPLKNNSVDIIVSAMVFEHLQDPDAAFKEFNRILKPKGSLVFATPCIYNIVTIINRLIPHYLSQKLGTLLTGTIEEDTYPTKYKINSVRKIRKICKNNDFKNTDLIMYQPPPYAFVFSKLVCKSIIIYFKLINKYEFTKFLRGIIIARCQKY